MSVEMEGFLRELAHRVGEPVQYTLMTDEHALQVNRWLGHTVRIQFTGRKACIHCGRAVKKLYQNGYCFPCVTTLAECDLCIVKPHECHFHQGTCRDPAFAAQQCMIPHYVYLAWSSGIKVGLTRKGREFARWVDQGAAAAILLAELPTRKEAGELEMVVAAHLPDKTDWRKMLAFEVDDTLPVRLRDAKHVVVERLGSLTSGSVVDDDTVYRFEYPRIPGLRVETKALSLDRDSTVEGTLTGIKGQYLMFAHGVFHVKRHAGYHVQVSVS
ncbi:MAG: DUF2797 domain-containing protein [Alicyclobacillaceae bacterium]|nr:DUF2797 domain-containing protein [Alicyclobacillaceae bacterium]